MEQNYDWAERQLGNVTLKYLNTALTDSRPDALAVHGYEAGLYYVRAKHAAADLEAGRTVFRMQIRDRLMEQGAKKTEAEDQARQHPDYLAYERECRALEMERDYAEVLYKALRDRMYALRGTEVAL